MLLKCLSDDCARYWFQNYFPFVLFSYILVSRCDDTYVRIMKLFEQICRMIFKTQCLFAFHVNNKLNLSHSFQKQKYSFHYTFHTNSCINNSRLAVFFSQNHFIKSKFIFRQECLLLFIYEIFRTLCFSCSLFTFFYFNM